MNSDPCPRLSTNRNYLARWANDLKARRGAGDYPTQDLAYNVGPTAEGTDQRHTPEVMLARNHREFGGAHFVEWDSFDHPGPRCPGGHLGDPELRGKQSGSGLLGPGVRLHS